jgi:hypothetical protein
MLLRQPSLLGTDPFRIPHSIDAEKADPLSGQDLHAPRSIDEHSACPSGIEEEDVTAVSIYNVHYISLHLLPRQSAVALISGRI